MLSKVLFVLLVFALSQCQLPDNPCPNIFQYRSNRGVNYGEIRIPYDGSKELNIAVNVSMIGLYQNVKLKIDLLTPTDKILTSTVLLYRLNFPGPYIIPKITQIRFNNQIYCYGPSEPVTSEGVTNLWSNLQFRITEYTYTIQDNLNDLNSQLHQQQNSFLNQAQGQIFGQSNPFIPQLSKVSSTPEPPQRPQLPPKFSSEEVCGTANDIETLVIKGEKTRENEYPWLVAMFNRRGVSYEFQCTANLISPQYVVTAAHCVWFFKAPLIPKEDILLVLGRSDISHWASTGALIRTAIDVTPHPDYTQNSGHCDIAVIKMNEEITFKATARPICLWDSDENLKKIVNLKGVVAGWGKTATADTVAEPRKANLPIVSQETCLRSNSAFKNITTYMTFCAGNRDGTGPCSGDSGAAFMLKREGRFYLRGIVSTAIKNQDYSCNLDEYIVFADVAKLKSWILGIIRN